MLLMKSIVIYVIDTGVRTITRPKVPARALTQNDAAPPIGFNVQKSYTSSALKNTVPL